MHFLCQWCQLYRKLGQSEGSNNKGFWSLNWPITITLAALLFVYVYVCSFSPSPFLFFLLISLCVHLLGKRNQSWSNAWSRHQRLFYCSFHKYLSHLTFEYIYQTRDHRVIGYRLWALTEVTEDPCKSGNQFQSNLREQFSVIRRHLQQMRGDWDKEEINRTLFCRWHFSNLVLKLKCKTGMQQKHRMQFSKHSFLDSRERVKQCYTILS